MIKYLILLSFLMLAYCNGSYPMEKYTWNYFQTVNCLKTVVIPKGKNGRYHNIFQIYMPCKLLGTDGKNMSILCDDSYNKLGIPDEYNTPYHPFIHESSCGDDFYKIINNREINKILFDNSY